MTATEAHTITILLITSLGALAVLTGLVVSLTIQERQRRQTVRAWHRAATTNRRN